MPWWREKGKEKEKERGSVGERAEKADSGGGWRGEFIVDISMGNHNSRASASEQRATYTSTYRDGISSSPLPHKSPMH